MYARPHVLIAYERIVSAGAEWPWFRHCHTGQRTSCWTAGRQRRTPRAQAVCVWSQCCLRPRLFTTTPLRRYDRRQSKLKSGTGYSAAYMSQIRDQKPRRLGQKHFAISEVAADWHSAIVHCPHQRTVELAQQPADIPRCPSQPHLAFAL